MINPLCATQSQEEKKLQLAARAGTRGRQAFADDGSDMRVPFCITEVSRFKGYPPTLAISKIVIGVAIHSMRFPGCEECDRLWSEYAQATFDHVRSEGKLKLAALQSDVAAVKPLTRAMGGALHYRESML